MGWGLQSKRVHEARWWCTHELMSTRALLLPISGLQPKEITSSSVRIANKNCVLGDGTCSYLPGTSGKGEPSRVKECTIQYTIHGRLASRHAKAEGSSPRPWCRYWVCTMRMRRSVSFTSSLWGSNSYV
jgi:hypothetical protein